MDKQYEKNELLELGFGVVPSGRNRTIYPQITVTEKYININGAAINKMPVDRVMPLINDDEAWLLLIPATSGKASLPFKPDRWKKGSNKGKTITNRSIIDKVLRILRSTGRSTRNKRYHIKGSYSETFGGLLFDIKEALLPERGGDRNAS